MPKVENKKIINNIARRSFKENKLRNIFAIISVILTMLMFTTLFTVFFSMKSSLEITTMRQSGSSAHGTYKNLTKEQLEIFKSSKNIKQLEYSIYLANVENKSLEKITAEMRFGTDGESKFMFSNPTTGKMPTKFNEVAMDKRVLDALGIEAKIGNEVDLEYSLNGELQKDKFILSGYWEGDFIAPASQIWISKDYIEEKLKSYNNIGAIQADVKFKNSKNIEKNMKKSILEVGYGINDIDYGVNWAYIGSVNKDLSLIITIIATIILIMTSGYLIIYNIFFISVSRDIRFYGLLKAIGTTSKQIGRIIRKQAIFILIIGTPVGLTLGYLVARGITPLVLNQINLEVAAISTNPLIFIVAIIFTLITILISIRKPAKIAGRISPVEAIKTSDGKLNKGFQFKNFNFGNFYSMSIGNVFRSKRRFVFVVASLSLSLIIFNSTFVIIKSFSMDKYISKNLRTDFLIADSNYFNVNRGYNGEDTITKEFISLFTSQEGVLESSVIKYKEEELNINDELKRKIDKLILENPEIFTGNFKEMALAELSMKKIIAHIYSVDKMSIKELDIIEGNIDYEKLKTGKYVIASNFKNDKNNRLYNIGEVVTINSNEYEIMAIANIPYSMSVRHDHSFELDFFMEENEFLINFGEIPAMSLIANVKAEEEENIESFMKNFIENKNKDIKYESKASYEKEFKSMENTYKGIGFLLSIILGIVGMLNFVNTMITSIISRKKEFAMLESIGMTKKQLKKMLVIESNIYILSTTIIVLTVGNIVSYIGLKVFIDSIWFFAFNFTIIPEIIAIISMFIFSLIITMIVTKLLFSETIVDRLRVIE